ncbi:MAG: CoA-binding protein [Anaerolineae bacterium]|nr:CoA-binding protein [Anaerolineae bacterium]
MPDLNTDEQAQRDVLTQARVIAVVGHSDKPERASYQIAQYLRQAGYTVYPVNPALQQIDGQPSYASLQDVPEPIDIVDVFRQSEHLPAIVDDAIAAGAKTVWGQLGVSSEAARQKALDAGLNIIMDRCIKIEHSRLGIGRR